jgi:hypothetical protein
MMRVPLGVHGASRVRTTMAQHYGTDMEPNFIQNPS